MNNEMCCTLNDCGESQLPKLGLIVLGPLSGRQNFASGPREWFVRVAHECSPQTKVHEGNLRTWGPRFVVSLSYCIRSNQHAFFLFTQGQ